MFNSLSLEKLRLFVAAAGSYTKQEEADKIWNENMWKLNLEMSEITALRDAWAEFVVKGDRGGLDSISAPIIKRLNS